jgi:hypothetical protein
LAHRKISVGDRCTYLDAVQYEATTTPGVGSYNPTSARVIIHLFSRNPQLSSGTKVTPYRDLPPQNEKKDNRKSARTIPKQSKTINPSQRKVRATMSGAECRDSKARRKTSI